MPKKENPAGGPGIGKNTNVSDAERLLPSPKKIKIESSDLISAIVDVLRSAGLDVDTTSLDTSGDMTRCPLHDRPNSRDGAYTVYLDEPPTVWWQNWVTGESETWCSRDTATFTPEERAEYRARAERNRAAKEEELKRRHAEAAVTAKRIYGAASQDIVGHPYAEKKKLKNCHLLRRATHQEHDCLVIPLYDSSGSITSLSFIGPDKVFGQGTRDKTLLAGGKKGFYPVGPTFRGASSVLIGEGVATVDACVTATGLPGVAAIDAGNLAATAQIVRDLIGPDADIIILADDDRDTSGNPGMTAASKAASACGGRVAVPDMSRTADMWDVLHELGPDALRQRIEAAPAQRDTPPDPLAAARERFPRTPYPWHILPDSLAASLQQLARSCATSATPLPGYALCLICAALGRTFSVSAKESWTEPLILWVGDIRDSGAGKTPAMRALAQAVDTIQAREHEQTEKDLEAWEARPPKDRRGEQPPRARGYYMTGLTLEGVHSELAGHPTGGIVAMMSELSALISGQGEYKSGKGTDRESWLCLHDGHSARIVRANGRSSLIQGARVQVFGGIQPGIFRRVFSAQDGTFLEDGTIFRFLLVHEPPMYHPLAAESWSLEHSTEWATILTRAYAWADSRDDVRRKPIAATLNREAQERFLAWRNDIEAKIQDFPPLFRGFIPKAYGYALRLAGALHALDRFAADREPGAALHLLDIERGIQATEFYLGQALDALRLLMDKKNTITPPQEVSPRTVTLARVLESMRENVQGGRLAIGYITEKYNAMCAATERLPTPHAMGALLRQLGLRTSPGLHDCNGRKRARCLEWDKKTETFVKQVSEVSKSLNL